MKVTLRKVLLLALFVLVLTALFVVGASATVTDAQDGTSVASYTDANDATKYTDTFSEAITNAKEVSLTSVIVSLVTGGKIRLITCGRIILKKVCALLNPSTFAASYCPTGMDSIPAR